MPSHRFGASTGSNLPVTRFINECVDVTNNVNRQTWILLQRLNLESIGAQNFQQLKTIEKHRVRDRLLARVKNSFHLPKGGHVLLDFVQIVFCDAFGLIFLLPFHDVALDEFTYHRLIFDFAFVDLCQHSLRKHRFRRCRPRESHRHCSDV